MRHRPLSLLALGALVTLPAFAIGCAADASSEATGAEGAAIATGTGSVTGGPVVGAPIGTVNPPPPIAVPPVVAPIESGTAWQHVTVSGSAPDSITGATTALGGEYYVIHGRGAIASTSLPAVTQKALLNSMATTPAALGDDEVIIVPKSLSDSLVAAPPTTAPNRRPEFLCSDSDHTYSKSLGLDRTFDYSKSTDGNGFNGSLSLVGFTSGYATATISYTEKQSWESACIPWIVVHNVTVNGNATVEADVAMNASYSKKWSDKSQVADPTLGTVSIYGIPVTFTLPITVGIDASAQATLALDGSFYANSVFNVLCSGSDCNGTMTGTHIFNTNGPPTGSASARVKVAPYIEADVHAKILSDDVLSASVGVKGALQGDLFAYYGNTCGDADGDGTNETVGGATLDAKVDVAVVASASILSHSVASHTWDVWNPHVGFWKLWDSGLLEPMIQTSVSGTTVTAKGRMRPCWPYTESMTYSMHWPDGVNDSITEPAATFFSDAHNVGYGMRTISLEAMSDSAGRTLDTTTSRKLYISHIVIGPIGPIGGVATTAETTAETASEAAAQE